MKFKLKEEAQKAFDEHFKHDYAYESEDERKVREATIERYADKRPTEPITVGELIEILQNFPADVKVYASSNISFDPIFSVEDKVDAQFNAVFLKGY
jgi:1,4-dihydroxy-2-naphthoyl-CoA synthase